MEYNFTEIEKKWKQYWADNKVYKVANGSEKPKCYVLDMFPYPSGAGLHVGHPLGYIASDIYSRYKRLKGYNVLHPMGFDAFGLPAEQYAIETGQHPAKTTEDNIKRYKEQLDNIGFCYDWSREVRTSDPKYYKWTQWIFLQLFESWYDRSSQKARPISDLISIFDASGNGEHTSPGDEHLSFNAAEWQQMSSKEQRSVLMTYRIAYQGYADVWWCEALGTVLANDEVVNGVSERGGHPVERKRMRQWFLRITEYAERLLSGLEGLDWTDAMKEMQRNWIGKSSGAVVKFGLSKQPTSLSFGEGRGEASISVFTTRPDTIFGVDFMVLAPEHELVDSITTKEQAAKIEEYKRYVKSRSERERISEVKQVTGCFTGSYVVHPFTGKEIPVWISEYVLAGYGTGAIMAVPAGDERDNAFAKHFNIPITNIFGDRYTGESAYSEKAGTIENSEFLSGMKVAEAIETAIEVLEEKGIGVRKVNYRLRDAGFSRQRYWGEPFPITYVDEVAYGVGEDGLPVELPYVDSYKPGPEGQGPLANITDWVKIKLDNTTQDVDSTSPSPWGRAGEGLRETNTMPGYAGSSWYFLRYMDPGNDNEFASRAATDYWQQVDLYVGGTEHAVGHLLYARMWTKVLHDLGHIGFDEPFKKLLNQGMIQGKSYFFKTVKPLEGVAESNSSSFIISSNKKRVAYEQFATEKAFTENTSLRLRYGQEYVDTNGRLTYDSYQRYIGEHGALPFEILWDKEGGQQFVQLKEEVEKMSKSKYNVVNPDDIVAQYGADTFRMYEMFLGPIDVSKPWDTKGIEGVHRFLKKLWRLYSDESQGIVLVDDVATEDELRIVHKTIKKIGEDIERFSFNTSVSQLMICVNELSSLGCHKRAVLEPLVILLSPFAPHIAEEIWQGCLKQEGSVLDAAFPEYNEAYLTESSIKYPVAINGKRRVDMDFAADATKDVIETAVLADATVQKWMDGKPMRKFIFVSGKMINVVV